MSLKRAENGIELVEQAKSPYDKTADRVLDAVRELNSALTEAHECAEMRVFLAATPITADDPMRIEPLIYRLSHSTVTFKVKLVGHDEGTQWRQVKDPEVFKQAAGAGVQGLNR